MKQVNIGLAIVAMALTTGCSQNEVLEGNASRPDRSIHFSNYLARPNSRATEVGNEQLKTVGFKVWSYLSTTTNGGSADITEVGNTIAAHNTLDGSSLFTWTNNAWKPADNATHNWPEDGKGKLSFYAIGIADPNLVTAFTAPILTKGAQFSFNTSGRLPDLVAAQSYNQTYASNNGTVAFTFKHLLTQVRFTAKTVTPDFKAKILSIKVLHVAKQAVFNFDISGAKIGTGWDSWGVAGYNDHSYFDATTDAANFPVGYPKDDVADRDQPGGNQTSFITTTAKDIWLDGGTQAANGALMFIPREDSSGLDEIKLEIKYQCYTLEDPATKPGVYAKEGEPVTSTIQLLQADKWPMNTKVCYNLTLSMPKDGYVSYETAVEPWNDGGDVEFIPKNIVIP